MCVFAYNTSQHESTRFTPFEIMVGHTATLQIDIDVRNKSPEEVLQDFQASDETYDNSDHLTQSIINNCFW